MNKVLLIGNLTRAPEYSETSAGVQACRFTVAVNRNYANQNGERDVDYFNVTAWRTLAENVNRYALKGKKVAVSGSVELHTYEDKYGNKRTAVEIIARDVEFLSPRQTEEPPAAKTGVKPSLEPVDDDVDIPF